MIDCATLFAHQHTTALSTLHRWTWYDERRHTKLRERYLPLPAQPAHDRITRPALQIKKHHACEVVGQQRQQAALLRPSELHRLTLVPALNHSQQGRGGAASHVLPLSSRQLRAAKFRILRTTPRARLVVFDFPPLARIAVLNGSRVASYT